MMVQINKLKQLEIQKEMAMEMAKLYLEQKEREERLAFEKRKKRVRKTDETKRIRCQTSNGKDIRLKEMEAEVQIEKAKFRKTRLISHFHTFRF